MKNPVFSYIGGKFKLRKWIASHLPGADRYIEAFAGSASVFFEVWNKYKECTINDLNSDIYNFFKVLREDHDKLIRLLEFTPYSRETYKEACDILKSDEQDSVKRAWAWFVMQNLAFSGKPFSGFKINKRGNKRADAKNIYK